MPGLTTCGRFDCLTCRALFLRQIPERSFRQDHLRDTGVEINYFIARPITSLCHFQKRPRSVMSCELAPYFAMNAFPIRDLLWRDLLEMPVQLGTSGSAGHRVDLRLLSLMHAALVCYRRDPLLTLSQQRSN